MRHADGRCAKHPSGDNANRPDGDKSRDNVRRDAMGRVHVVSAASNAAELPLAHLRRRVLDTLDGRKLDVVWIRGFQPRHILHDWPIDCDDSFDLLFRNGTWPEFTPMVFPYTDMVEWWVQRNSEKEAPIKLEEGSENLPEDVKKEEERVARGNDGRKKASQNWSSKCRTSERYSKLKRADSSARRAGLNVRI